MVSNKKTATACYLGIIAFYLSSSAFAIEKFPDDLLAYEFHSGQTVTLSKYNGQVRYIDFWASWCKPCRKALPALEWLHNKYTSQAITIIAINIDENKKDAEQFLMEYPVSYLQLYDPKGKLGKIFKLRSMPMGLLIDKQNTIRYKHHGFKDKDTEKLDALFKQLLQENFSEKTNNRKVTSE